MPVLQPETENALATTLLANLGAFQGFTRRRLGNDQLAADAVQESLLRALKNEQALSHAANLLAWFYRSGRQKIAEEGAPASTAPTTPRATRTNLPAVREARLPELHLQITSAIMKTITIDPICGMEVEENSPHRAIHQGTEYLFCSDGCRQKFEKEPERWAEKAKETKSAPSAPSQGAGSEKVRQKGRGAKWTDYIPLLVIVALTLLSASAKQVSYGGWNGMTWMHDFMGFFLVVFSMFKFFNMEGFADGFQMYDLLAKPFRPYAYVYPFIEAGLGLGYLAHWEPKGVYLITIIVTVFGSLGVFNALRKRMDIECACMGTVLNVPLSTVALVENLGMAAMAAVMLAVR